MDYQLKNIDGKLSLIITNDNQIKPVCVDFNSESIRHRLKFGGKENLLKACGFKKLKHPKIIDATAGFAIDSFILAAYGANVILLERESFMVELIKDGLSRAYNNPELNEIVKNMQLIQADAVKYLSSLANELNPDIVYLDPMFPDKKKSAASKKEMEILQKITTFPKDEELLLHAALTVANKRVVVKRSKLAPYINNQKPDLIISGNSGRFDVYITHDK